MAAGPNYEMLAQVLLNAERSISAYEKATSVKTATEHATSHSYAFHKPPAGKSAPVTSAEILGVVHDINHLVNTTIPSTARGDFNRVVAPTVVTPKV